jgi:DNA-binding GntR family transcriptional regulator
MKPVGSTAKTATVLPEEDLPLFERAFLELRERILTGEIKPGTVLSEARLAEELGMSRTPVREALARLARDGFAQRFPGRGVIVRELSLKEILDVFEVQACLEEYAISRVLGTGRTFNTARLEELIRAQEAAAEAGDTHAFLKHDRSMHLYVVGHLENERLTEIMKNASDLLIYAGHRALRSTANIRETIAEHRALVSALGSGDPEAALAASRAHVEGAKRRLLG